MGSLHHGANESRGPRLELFVIDEGSQIASWRPTREFTVAYAQSVLVVDYLPQEDRLSLIDKTYIITRSEHLPPDLSEARRGGMVR